MAYISSGAVKDKRPWSLNVIVDWFWGILGVIYSFILTMFSMDASNTYGKRRRSSGWGGGSGGGGGGGGGWGPSGGGGGPGRGGRGGLDNVRGIDHSAPAPACGSCCG